MCKLDQLRWVRKLESEWTIRLSAEDCRINLARFTFSAQECMRGGGVVGLV